MYNNILNLNWPVIADFIYKGFFVAFASKQRAFDYRSNHEKVETIYSQRKKVEMDQKKKGEKKKVKKKKVKEKNKVKNNCSRAIHG